MDRADDLVHRFPDADHCRIYALLKGNAYTLAMLGRETEFGGLALVRIIPMVIRGTIRQLMTPDRLRGRMTSVNMIFFMGGPQLGDLEAGVVAAALGAPVAIFAGGLATVLLTGWIAWQYPRLRCYTSDTGKQYQVEMQANPAAAD